MKFRNEDDALELHNCAPERLGFLGAVIGAVAGAALGIFVDGLWGVALVFVGAAGAGVAGWRVGLLAGNTRVFADIPGHPDGGITIRACHWALQAYWPERWAEIQSRRRRLDM